MLIYIIWNNGKTHDLINMDNVTDIERYERILNFHYANKMGMDYKFNTAEEAKKAMHDIASAYMKDEKLIVIVPSITAKHYNFD